MIEPDAGNIAQALRNHAQENEAAQTLINSQPRYRGEDPGTPDLTVRMQHWAQLAPTLPAGALLSVARANIDPYGPVGQYLVNNAVPAMIYKPTSPAEAAGLGLPGSAGYALKNLMSDPVALEHLKQMPLDQLSNLDASKTPSGQPSLPAIQAAGLGPSSLPDPNDFWSKAIAGVREAGAVAQSGVETVSMGVKQQAAGLAHGISNLVHGEAPSQGANAYGLPAGPQDYTTPKFSVPGLKDIPGLNALPGIKESPELNGFSGGGVPIHFGTQQQLTDPSQITLVQQAEGKSLGHGILPGGPAVAAAQAAQEAAATVAGHALTPGRALASFVTTPDSLAYRALSGVVDAQVALHADPALLVMGEVTDAIKNARSIGVTTNDALHATADHLVDNLGPQNADAIRAWAGKGDLKTAIVNKLVNEPGSLNALYENSDITAKDLATSITGRKAGLLSGLYDSVHPDNFQQWLVDPTADKSFFTPVSKMGFTELGTKTNWSLPATLQGALADANTPDEVRAAVQDHLSSIRTLPTLGVHPIANMRWSSVLPTQLADVADADSLLTRARQDLQLLKVPVKEWDNYLPQVVKAEGSYDDAFKAFKAIGDRGAQNILDKIPGYKGLVAEEASLKDQVMALGDHVVPTPQNQALLDRLDSVSAQLDTHDQFARKLTNYFYEKGQQSRLWHNAELGGSQLVDGLSPAGGMTAVEGPFWPSELLNRSIPTLGGTAASENTMREIQRAVGTWAPLFNSPVAGALPRAARSFLVDTIADHLTDFMKTSAFAHLGTPVRIMGSQGARLAAAGVGDLASNPIGLLGLAMNEDLANVDMTGEQLFSDIGGAQNRMAAAVGKATDFRSELAGGNKYVTNKWAILDTGTREGIDAWANRLSHASNDPFASEVARALVQGDGLDAVKQSVWDGPLAETRQHMVDANVTWGRGNYVGYSRDLVNRDQSDAWVEATAKILQDETGNNPDLLQQVADGIGGEITPRLKRQLVQSREAGMAPQSVTGPMQLEIDKSTNWIKRSVNAMLSSAAGQPTRKWLAIPAVKQLYWQDAERLLPYLSEADAESLRGMASGYGVELPQVAKDATHTISLAQADQIAKAYAIQGYSKIFYNPGSRPILVDQLRNIIPFANIVSDTATTWARLVAQNPKVLRVAQMGLTDANQSGWFSKDQYGKLAFSMIPGSAMPSLIGGMNVASGNGPGQDNPAFPVSGEASRLNIVTQGWPSVGPVVSLGMPALLSAFGANDISDKILNYTDPYGTPSTLGDVFKTLLPGWLDKLETSGYFSKIPGLGPNPYQQRMLNQTAMAVMRYKMSTGHYSSAQMQQVWDDSIDAAKKMYLIQTAAQFISPVAPEFSPTTKMPGGAAIQTYVLTNDYYKMLQTNNNDSYKTTLQFITKYGPDNIFAAQPFTRPTIYGLPTTAEADVWKSQHSDFAAEYGSIYGYFAPQGGGFDYQAFLKQIADGTRQPLTGPQWYQLAEARIGNAAWDQFRRSLPAHLNAAQQAQVDGYKQTLAKEYPGFNVDSLKLPSDTKPQTVTAFREAIQDPAVKNLPMSKAIGAYLDFRDRVIQTQASMGLSSTGVSTSARAADLRNALYQYGSDLAAKIPQFSNVWQSVFSFEVQNQQTQDAAA